MIVTQYLEDLGFIHTHNIEFHPTVADAIPFFKRIPNSMASKSPSVYLWVAEDQSTGALNVLYVGKAGKGVEQRSAQHFGGFKNSGTGQKNAEALKGVLADGCTKVKVFTRPSGNTTLFGRVVSLYSTEEEALCAVLAPRLNRQVFPTYFADVDSQKMKTSEKAEIRQVTRIGAIMNDRMREHDLGTVDDVLAQMEDVYSSADRELLAKMLCFVEKRLLGPAYGSKLIRGYTGQLSGCNGVTTLSYGQVGKSGRMAGNGWIARIYFGAHPRIGFPAADLVPLATGLVEVNKHVFSPLDAADLFNRPEIYLRSISS